MIPKISMRRLTLMLGVVALVASVAGLAHVSSSRGVANASPIFEADAPVVGVWEVFVAALRSGLTCSRFIPITRSCHQTLTRATLIPAIPTAKAFGKGARQ